MYNVEVFPHCRLSEVESEVEYFETNYRQTGRVRLKSL